MGHPSILDQLKNLPKIDLIGILSLVTAYFYAAAWVFYGSIYNYFGIAIDDAGVTSDFLIIRAGFATTISLLILGVLSALGVDRFLLGKDPTQSPGRQVLLILLTIASALISTRILTTLIELVYSATPTLMALVISAIISIVMAVVAGGMQLKFFAHHQVQNLSIFVLLVGCFGWIIYSEVSDSESSSNNSSVAFNVVRDNDSCLVSDVVIRARDKRDISVPVLPNQSECSDGFNNIMTIEDYNFDGRPDVTIESRGLVRVA